MVTDFKAMPASTNLEEISYVLLFIYYLNVVGRFLCQGRLGTYAGADINPWYTRRFLTSRKEGGPLD
jgi:hypothetical protein